VPSFIPPFHGFLLPDLQPAFFAASNMQKRLFILGVCAQKMLISGIKWVKNLKIHVLFILFKIA